MTTTIDVSAKQDFWHRLCRTRPLRAICEIVWNSLDADASNVSIDFKVNGLGGLEEIVVTDDGDGIPIATEGEHVFAALGGSHKARNPRTEHKRIVHGKFGEGRFRAFSLGEIVAWETVYLEHDKMMAYEITGNVAKPGQFVLSDVRQLKNGATGTTVVVRNVERHDGILLGDGFREDIARSFAPYLLNYRDVSLSVVGKKIDTKDIVARRKEIELAPIPLSNGDVITAKLEIVEWNSISGRGLYLCDENGFTLSERTPDVRAPGFNFGAYLKSKYFSALDEGALIDMDLPEGVGNLLSAARSELAQYFKHREREKTKALISSWKAEGVYPYAESTSSSKAEEKARQVFDICAVTVHDYVDGFENQTKSAKQLSFRLLKEAIESNSPELSRILTEVLLLPKAKQKEFSELLDKAKLTNIIDTVKDINTRISVATGLRALVCDKDIRDSVKEREHIHRIVEANSWIFGEQYALGRSEVGLTNLLREHLKLLKRDTRVTEPVLQSGARIGRIDILLAKLVKISGRSDDNHLVIELKRANKKLSHKDYTQLFEYASTIIRDPRFDKTQVTWDFWLVGSETDDTLNELCNSSDRPPGCAHIFKTHKAQVWVKTWGQILHDCLARHEYIRQRLELEVVEEDSVSYLQEMYMKVVRPE